MKEYYIPSSGIKRIANANGKENYKKMHTGIIGETDLVRDGHLRSIDARSKYTRPSSERKRIQPEHWRERSAIS